MMVVAIFDSPWVLVLLPTMVPRMCMSGSGMFMSGVKGVCLISDGRDVISHC